MITGELKGEEQLIAGVPAKPIKETNVEEIGVWMSGMWPDAGYPAHFAPEASEAGARGEAERRPEGRAAGRPSSPDTPSSPTAQGTQGG